MPTPAPSTSPLRFGDAGRFELQPAERRLLVDGRPASLGGRALDVLITLAARPDRLVSKSELLQRVWQGLVVEEANLQMQISNLRKVLGGDVIATVPGRGYRFTAALDTKAANAPLPSPAPPAAGPQRLFGRDADLERLESMLRVGGCVTVVGTAGVGKTSLAQAAAARWRGRSVWVDLAGLTHGSQVTGAVARAAGVELGDHEPAARLLAALKGQALLLVLDNAEHVVEDCAVLAAQLAALPQVRLLVTSQLPLAVAGERVQRLEPLALAGLDDGALAMLVERIVAADHRFRVTPAALPQLHAICEHLDGLPLALAMAGARVPLIGLQRVHDALAQRFSLLTRGHRAATGRHRTLHDALDWSHGLLGEAEQRLFRALGVFAGGFMLDLAVALVTDDSERRWDVIDSLAVLVERSLVAVSADDPPRYRLLESLRAYALEQLGNSGEEDDARRRHAAAVLALFCRHLRGDAALQALCVAEMDNAREAIAWSRRHDLVTAADLATRVASVATFTAWRREATDWLMSLEPAMQSAAGESLPAQLQAAWWTEAGRLLGFRGDPRAAPTARRAVALWEPLGQPEMAVRAATVWARTIRAAGPELDEACAALRARADAAPGLSMRGRLLVQGALVQAARTRGDHDEVVAGRHVELALARETGWQEAIDAAESNVVIALNRVGRHAEAAERGHALLARIDAAGGDANGNLPWVMSGLVTALLELGRLEEAAALVPRTWSVGERFGAPVAQPLVPLLAALQRRFEAAARLVGQARRGHELLDMPLDDQDEQRLARALALASKALGPERARVLEDEGRSLGAEEARALAV